MDKDIEKKPKEFLGLRLSALIEIVIFFVIAIPLDHFFGKQDRFFSLCPHPFWIIVLLITVQYGTAEGLFAALISSILLFTGKLPEQTITIDYYEHLTHLLANPVMWFMTAVIIGELRVRQIKETQSLKADLAIALDNEKNISIAYEQLKKNKEFIESSYASQMQTAINAYNALKRLENLDLVELQLGIQNLVLALINCNKFSIYTLNNEGLILSNHYGWVESDKFPNHYSIHSSLYQSVIGGQRILSVINKDDEIVLHNEGLIAGPLINKETSEIFGMLKIEDLGFLDLNFHTAEIFRVICEWVGLNWANSKEYHVAKAQSMINVENLWYSFNFFQKQKDFLIQLSKRMKFPLSLLIISIGNFKDLSKEEQKESGLILKEIIMKNLRGVDLAFDYDRSGAEFAVLLVGTPLKNVAIVSDRISIQLEKSQIKDKAKFSFYSEELNTVD